VENFEECQAVGIVTTKAKGKYKGCMAIGLVLIAQAKKLLKLA
jgi:hypothetical protein